MAGVLALLSGCGSMTPAPRVLTPAAPGGFQVNRYSEAGLRLAMPRDWTVVTVHLPLVALVTSGPAVISLWRYPEPAAAAGGANRQLHQALHRLILAAQARNGTLRLVGSSTGSVAGLPAVQLQTVQRIGQALREVHSTHLYVPGRELVLEEYAPVSMFAALDRSVFSPVRRSVIALGR